MTNYQEVKINCLKYLKNIKSNITQYEMKKDEFIEIMINLCKYNEDNDKNRHIRYMLKNLLPFLNIIDTLIFIYESENPCLNDNDLYIYAYKIVEI